MKGGKTPLGYTIIEVMIVLAISGTMFAIAAQFIAGKQARTSFAAGSNEFAASIQDVIEEVQNGRYSDIAFRCNVAASTLIFTPAPDDPQNNIGKNEECVFLGKLMHFSVASEKTKYETFSLAGKRLNTVGAPVASLDEATPTPIIGPGASPVDLTSSSIVPQNLDVERITVNGTATTTYGFGFVQGVGSIEERDANTYNTGAQTVDLVYAPAVSGPAMTKSVAADAIRSGGLQKIASAELCLTDGERFARISVGQGQDAKLSVKLKRVAACS